MVHKEDLDLMGSLEELERQDYQDKQVQMAGQDLLVELGHLANQVHLDSKEDLDLEVI